eukprot:g14077.t1
MLVRSPPGASLLVRGSQLLARLLSKLGSARPTQSGGGEQKAGEQLRDVITAFTTRTPPSKFSKTRTLLDLEYSRWELLDLRPFRSSFAWAKAFVHLQRNRCSSVDPTSTRQELAALFHRTAFLRSLRQQRALAFVGRRLGVLEDEEGDAEDPRQQALLVAERQWQAAVRAAATSEKASASRAVVPVDDRWEAEVDPVARLHRHVEARKSERTKNVENESANTRRTAVSPSGVYECLLALVKARREVAVAEGFSSWARRETAKTLSLAEAEHDKLHAFVRGFKEVARHYLKSFVRDMELMQENEWRKATSPQKRRKVEDSTGAGEKTVENSDSAVLKLQEVVDFLQEEAPSTYSGSTPTSGRAKNKEQRLSSLKSPASVFAYDAAYYRDKVRLQQRSGEINDFDLLEQSGQDLSKHLPFRKVLPRLLEKVSDMYGVRVCEVDSLSLRRAISGSYLSWWHSGWETYRQYHIFQVFEARKNENPEDEGAPAPLYSRDPLRYGLPPPQAGEESRGFIYVKCFNHRESPAEMVENNIAPRSEELGKGHVVLHTNFARGKKFGSTRMLRPQELKALTHELAHCLHKLLASSTDEDNSSEATSGAGAEWTSHTASSQESCDREVREQHLQRESLDLYELPACVNEFVCGSSPFLRDLVFLHETDLNPVKPEVLKANCEPPHSLDLYAFAELAQMCAVWLELHDDGGGGEKSSNPKLLEKILQEDDVEGFEAFVRDAWRRHAPTSWAGSGRSSSSEEVELEPEADTDIRTRTVEDAYAAAAAFDRRHFCPERESLAFCLSGSELPFLMAYVRAGALLKRHTKVFEEGRKALEGGSSGDGGESGITEFVRRKDFGWNRGLGLWLKEKIMSNGRASAALRKPPSASECRDFCDGLTL